MPKNKKKSKKLVSDKELELAYKKGTKETLQDGSDVDEDTGRKWNRDDDFFSWQGIVGTTTNGYQEDEQGQWPRDKNPAPYLIEDSRYVRKPWKKRSNAYMQIPLDIYFKRFFDVFYNFFDAINALDGSINYWVYGGAFRKIIHYHRLTSDIDMYVSTYEDFRKLEDVLLIMGFAREPYAESIFSHHYSFFGLDNINVDIIMPFDVLTADKKIQDELFGSQVRPFSMTTVSFEVARLSFMSPLTCMYWNDFTNSAAAMDSNHNFYYLDDFFNSIETRVLDMPHFRDVPLIKKLFREHPIAQKDEKWAYRCDCIINYFIEHRTLSHQYYRTRKMLNDEAYQLAGDNIYQYFENTRRARGAKFPKDFLDGVNSAEEFYINIGKIFADTFKTNKVMLNHLNSNIKKVNLEDIYMDKDKLAEYKRAVKEEKKKAKTHNPYLGLRGPGGNDEVVTEKNSKDIFKEKEKDKVAKHIADWAVNLEAKKKEK